MPEGFSLADIHDAIERKYGPVPINLGESGVVELQQLHRLPDSKQDELLSYQDRFNDMQRTIKRAQDPEEGEEKVTGDEIRQMKAEGIEALESILRLVCKNERDADLLIAACNHDQLVLTEVFKRYQESTQLGEASRSDDSSTSTAEPSSTTSEQSSDDPSSKTSES